MNKLLPILLAVVLSGCSSPDKVEVGLELLCTEQKRTETENASDYQKIACYENLIPSGRHAIQFLPNRVEVMIVDDYFGKGYHGYEATSEWIYIEEQDGNNIIEKINRISGEAQYDSDFRRCPTKCEISPGAFSKILKEYESKEEFRKEKSEEWELQIEEEVEEPDLVREKRKF